MLVEGELDLLEDHRELLRLVDHGRAHIAPPDVGGNRGQGIAVLRSIEVHVTEGRVGGTAKGRLARLPRTGEKHKTPRGGKGQ